MQKAKDTGFDEDRLFHYTDMDALIEELITNFEENTALMLKASKSTNFKKVVKRLLAEYERVK